MLQAVGSGGSPLRTAVHNQCQSIQIGLFLDTSHQWYVEIRRYIETQNSITTNAVHATLYLASHNRQVMITIHAYPIPNYAIHPPT